MTGEVRSRQIAAFWLLLVSRERELHKVHRPTDSILDELLQSLQRIHRGLYCEICSNSDPHELILTAQGRRELFPLVDVVIAAAPSVPGWKFIPLKPPMGFDFQTMYEGITLDPKAMWFLPLENPAEPSALGLRMGVPDFDPGQEHDTKNAALVLLDTALGERAAASDLEHVEVVALPTKPESQGYIELTDLPAYLQWRKRKQGSPLVS